MTGSRATGVSQTLFTITRAFPRILPRTVVLVAATVGVMFAALAVAVTLAAPAAGQVAYTLAQGTGTATLELVLANSWWLLPLVVMFGAMLAFTGVLLHFADAAVSRARVHGLSALTATLPRIPSAAMVTIVYTLTAILAILAAPLISLAALLGLGWIVVAERRGGSVPGWMPTKRTTVLLIIPFLLAGAIVIRWSLAFGEVFLARRGWRDALIASWERTADRIRPVGLVLLIAFGATAVISAGLAMLGVLSGVPWIELSLQLFSSLVVSPIPAMTLLVLFRDAGGPPSSIVEPRADTPRMSPRRFGTAIPVALSFVLVLTILTPAPQAFAAEPGTEAAPASTVIAEDGEGAQEQPVDLPDAVSSETPAEPAGEASDGDSDTVLAGTSAEGTPGASGNRPGELPAVGSFAAGQPALGLSVEDPGAAASNAFTTMSVVATSVTLNGASPFEWSAWEFGNDSTPIAGLVEAVSGGTIPTGTVQLWGNTLDVDDVPFMIGDPVSLVDGAFSLDRVNVLPGTRKLWVEYGGDSSHSAATSAEQLIMVQRKMLVGQATVLDPTGTITVGNRVVLRVDIDPNDQAVPGHMPSGELQIVETTGTGTVVGTAPLVDGVAIVEFVMSKRALHVAANVDGETRYWTKVNGGEWVVQAEPVASAVLLTTQQSVSLGSEAVVIADVQRPSGVPATGSVEFFFTEGVSGVRTPLGSVPVDAQGQAAINFCVGTSTTGTDPAVCASTPRAIVSAASTIRVIGEFTPDPGDAADRSLLPSASSWSTIEVTPAGTGGVGTCKIVQLRGQVYQLPHATSAQRASVGDPALKTKSNCSTLDGSGATVIGHRDGSVLTMQAQPRAGYELVEWRHDGVVIGTQPTLVWQLPDAPLKWTELFEPVYRPQCLSFDVRVTGSADVLRAGAVAISNPLAVSADCRLPGGGEGAYLGSTVRVDMLGAVNPMTTEPDVFARATANGVPITSITRLATGGQNDPVRHGLSFTMSRDTTVSVGYVPVCRTVQGDVSFFVASAGTTTGQVSATTPLTGRAELLTAPNCSTPLGSGYLRNSEVTVQAQLDGLYDVVAGWRVNGQLVPQLGRDVQATFVVPGDEVTIIEYDIARCYPVEASVDAGMFQKASGATVQVTPAPNCSDGSDRYAEGTAVTLAPQLGSSSGLGAQARIGAWKDIEFDGEGKRVGDRVAALDAGDRWIRSQTLPLVGSIANSGMRTVEIEAPLIATAYFYVASACSTITVTGMLTIADLRFPADPCGPGRYYDRAKQNLPPDGVYQGYQFRADGEQYEEGNPKRTKRVEEPMRQQYYEFDEVNYPRTALSFDVAGTDLAPFGTATMTQKSPSTARWTWTETQKLECTDTSCVVDARGDVKLKLSTCQALDVNVNITVAGDESQTVYTQHDLGLEDFEWITSDTYSYFCGGGVSWRPDTVAVLRAQAPIAGMEFIDWGQVDNVVGLEWFTEQDPRDPRAPLAVQVKTDDTKRALSVELHYAVHCAELDLDYVMGVVAPAPNCPGITSGMSYMVGTFVQVAAARKNANGRYFKNFNDNTVIAGTEGALDIAPEEVHGFDAGRPYVKSLVKELADFKAHLADPSIPFLYGPEMKDFNFYTGITLVQRDGQKIQGYYQYGDNTMEGLGKSFAKLGKAAVGALALGITAAMPFCPPCAGAVALLTASEFLVRLMPAGDFLGNIIAMANPMNFLDCTIKWGFERLPNRGSSEPGDVEAAKSFTGIVAGFGSYQAKSMVINNPAQLERFQKWSKMGTRGAAMATFAIGMYENRFWEMDFMNASASSLRDTAAYEDCLSDTWKNPVPPS